MDAFNRFSHPWLRRHDALSLIDPVDIADSGHLDSSLELQVGLDVVEWHSDTRPASSSSSSRAVNLSAAKPERSSKASKPTASYPIAVTTALTAASSGAAGTVSGATAPPCAGAVPGAMAGPPR
jgi:hypothetical protein